MWAKHRLQPINTAGLLCGFTPCRRELSPRHARIRSVHQAGFRRQRLGSVDASSRARRGGAVPDMHGLQCGTTTYAECKSQADSIARILCVIANASQISMMTVHRYEILTRILVTLVKKPHQGTACCLCSNVSDRLKAASNVLYKLAWQRQSLNDCVGRSHGLPPLPLRPPCVALVSFQARHLRA
jgi:hypothetical protein